MRYYVTSGPRRGATGTMTEGAGEVRLPHPSTPNVLCRYKVHSADAPTGQPGPEAAGARLRYAGDVAVRPGRPFRTARDG
ncbi:hypothetical protein [Streptomyces sp. DH24]|uniref:hypothetical protein n=1 Tax=Streptomyces sp. DH24 TaxID=3040123 RepID=UPI00244221E1|nr:hypothetical protein [Streptomyces sp. DH24]MDG9715451.1 hypothetical protein [Streptomyces sp. DH24]